MDIGTLIENYNNLKDDFHTEKGKYETLIKTKENLLKEKEEREHYNEILEKSKYLVMESSKYGKEQVKVQIENLVTSGLQYIFGKNMSFEIEIPPDKSRIEAEFYVVKEVNGVKRRALPQESKGGGIVDIVCLILRIAMLQAHSDPQLQGPLILDEPVKMVSEEYIDKVGEFLKQTRNYFGRQIIMSTHINYLSEIADKEYLFKMEDDISHATVVQ